MSEMRRIDYILNAKDPIQTIIDGIAIDCESCPGSKTYDCGEDCEYFLREYLEEEIEVNKSDTKTTLQKALDDVRKQPLKTKGELDNIKNDSVNPFMEEYKKIVTDTMELCKRKNADYGNATDKSFKQFGDISYQVRCFDKWNRINTLLKNGKAEVSESLEDSLLDLGNYLFLWVTSRRLNNEGDEIE